MADHDRGYRTGLREYSAGGGRKLEIVSGKVFSANQTYLHTTPRLPPPEPEPQLPYPPSRRGARSASASSSVGASVWCFSDPEVKRRRRVASYKAYGVEGKVKASFRKSFRWIKGKCSVLVHGR